MSEQIVNYKVVEIPESGSQPTRYLNVILKKGYKKENLEHVNFVHTETFGNSRRDLFKAGINHDHPDENLRGRKVYLKKICLNNKNQLQCWREMMIGLEIKHDLTTKIVDNWIEIKDGKAENAYYATLDEEGVSLKTALRTPGMLRRENKKKTPISFYQFAKIAQDLITTLIILKKNTVLHRDIIINNVLVHDLEGKDEKNPGPRTELIDFGWAKKIVNATKTMNTGTAGKIAPEIGLRSTDYTSLITEKPYSYPVDIFATGQLLAEIIELDKGFFKTFNKILGFRECGNPIIDENFGATMFALFAEKSEDNFSPMTMPTKEQKYAMINVNPSIRMPDPDKHREKFKNFIGVNWRGEFVKSDSLSQRYLRNFWFRYLDPKKGWTPERIDMTVDLIMRMLNYWPDHRPTAEELYQHEIFQEKEADGKPVLSPRNDAEGINNLVKLSNDQNFRVFQGKLALDFNSKLFMKTKSDHFDDNGANSDGPKTKTTIHEILILEEKIEFGTNVHLKASEVIDKMASTEDRGKTLDGLESLMQPGGMNLEDLNDFMQPEGQDQYIEKTEEEKNDAEKFDTALAKLNVDNAADWGDQEAHTNDKGEHFQVFGNNAEKNYEGEDHTNYDPSIYQNDDNSEKK